VILAVLVATVRPQKHSELIVSRCRSAFKTLGLHYIAVLERSIEATRLASNEGDKKA